jgi:AAA family ATP:ADP antiporter
MPEDDSGERRRSLVDVRPGELRALLLAAIYHFVLLAGYFVLRPLRDEVAVAGGVSRLPWLFAGTLAATLAVHPLFSALVVRWPARRFITVAYRFFAANLIVFFLVLGRSGAAVEHAAAIAFFVWTSVYNLFVVSVLWGFLADHFSADQARRLYGVVALGGSLGALAGAALTAGLVEVVGRRGMLLVSAALLEAAVLVVRRFPVAPERARAIGGTVLAGVRQVVRSPPLLAISGYLLLFTVGSTFLYFQQTDIIGHAVAGREARTALLARIDLAVQALTIAGQALITGRLLARSLAVTLALVPALSVGGFLTLALAPGLTVLVVVQVLRRSGELALSRPAREVLYTRVPREDKYKAKSFIDTFVYRAGDQMGAWCDALLRGLGLATPAIALAAVPLSALWLAVAVWLGRQSRR